MKTSLWAVLVALFAVCGCESRAATLPEFWLRVPSEEREWCQDDTSTVREIDHDPVTVNVMARGSWSTLVKTFYGMPRDSAFPVNLTTHPGAGGYYQVQWRVSEPGGVIGCWLPKVPVGLVATGW